MTKHNEDKEPWYQRAVRAFHERTDELARERQTAETFQEHPQDRIIREQKDRYDRELHYRATDKWWANREERQYIREIKQYSPEIRDKLIADLIRKRMAILEEKDRQAYLKEITPSTDRTLRERLGQTVRGERERDR